MQAPTSPLVEQKHFELNAWAILTSIGCIRILKDIVHDLLADQGTLTNLYIDVPLLSVFLLLLILIVRRKLSDVPLWVGFVLLLFCTWSFVRLGGVQGSSEYNFMALGVMFTLCYRGRDLLILVTLLFLAIIFANVDQMQHGRITQLLFRSTTHSYDSFYTSLISIGIVLLYFKNMLKDQTNKVRHSRELLSGQRSLIRQQHMDMLQQQTTLLEVTKRLHKDVQLYDDDIREQDKAIQNYIYLATQNLRLSMSRMDSVPDSFSKIDGLDKRLKEQIDALNVVVTSLITDLENTENDRIH